MNTIFREHRNITSLKEYNNSRLTANDVLSGNDFRRLKRSNKRKGIPTT